MTDLERTLEQLVERVVRRVLAEKPANDVYLTTDEAAELAKVTAGTIRRWIRAGRLIGHRAGRVMRVRRDDLVKLLRTGIAHGMSPEEMGARDGAA